MKRESGIVVRKTLLAAALWLANFACFIAAANRIGTDATLNFFGQSMIVGPRGQIYASVDEEVEGYAVAKIDLDEVRRYREELQILQARQPGAYRSIVKQY